MSKSRSFSFIVSSLTGWGNYTIMYNLSSLEGYIRDISICLSQKKNTLKNETGRHVNDRYFTPNM